VRLHQAGKLDEAEKAYKEFLEQNPDHPDILHLLGVLIGDISSRYVRGNLALRFAGCAIAATGTAFLIALS